jgi:hypothetical protein
VVNKEMIYTIFEVNVFNRKNSDFKLMYINCAAGVGRFRLGSRADRSLGCTNARPRKISSSVESRAASVNASTKKGASSEASPGNCSLVERAGELEVGSEDSVSQTGAETSEFHVERSRIPGWSPRALILFSFLFGPCRCPMIMGGYPVYDSELVSLNPPRLFSSIRSSPECVLCFCEVTCFSELFLSVQKPSDGDT